MLPCAPLRQSTFLVEDSLHDDSAMPVLSRAKILRRALYPEGWLAMLY